MACCQNLNRWVQCRLVQIHYHFVLMNRKRNLMACYHFAIRTQSPTGNLTANPNRIDCQIHSVSRFAIRCRTIHSSYPMSHYLKIRFQMNRSPMIHCRRNQTSPMSRLILRN